MSRALVLIWVLAMWLCGCAGPPASPGKAPTVVEVERLEERSSATGGERYSASVEPSTRVVVNFNSGGYVESVGRVSDRDGKLRLIQPGDPVKKGQVLCSLRSIDFSSRLEQAGAQVGRAEAQEQDARSQVEEARGGSRLARGQLLEARAAQSQARAALGELEATVAQARQAVREARAADQLARTNLARSQSLFDSDALIKPELDQALFNHQQASVRLAQAEEQLKGAQSRLEQGRTQVEQARGRVEQAAGQVEVGLAREQRSAAGVQAASSDLDSARAQWEQTRLAQMDASLKAPMDGVLLSRSVEVGSLVAPGAPAFEVAEVSQVRVTFGVPDLEVAALKLGQGVTIGTQSLPGEKFEGRVSTIYPEADPQSRVFRVEVKVSNPAQKLKVGMIASLYLGGGGSSVLTIPISAIVRRPDAPDKFSVYVLERQGQRSIARLRPVELGDPTGDRMVVVSGLKSGDEVVASGSNMISDGEEVAVQP
ncbi:efflux RND transporter periplasmic adaptor subunit [bacterium CPR1]|nr:efflux RND transporter periplasmic adaptor subunit [bacterium CPR1]